MAQDDVALRTGPLIEPERMLIDGRWVPSLSGAVFPVEDPGTGEIVAHVPTSEAADVDAAVLAARRAFEDGRWTRLSGAQRGVVLWRVSQL
ncbi:aldehyde dehydrogenase family protein, partial [Streptomyces sp. NPDC049590]|uniref:aldehyde dehydrogenase family protein n=1 Tax=Streptomyces sp. NPDC049590 TaxID=3154834 RepID=UPI003445918C